MIYSDQLKNILNQVRQSIADGDNEMALKHLVLADLYADFHKFEDGRLITAIQGLAKILDTSEPQAMESLVLQGFYDIERIRAIGGKSMIKTEFDMKKQVIFNQILPNFGVKPLTSRQQSELLTKIN